MANYSTIFGTSSTLGEIIPVLSSKSRDRSENAGERGIPVGKVTQMVFWGFACVANNAGNRIKSPISAANIMPHSNNPKRTVGKNPQKAYSTILIPRIKLVCIIAVPL